MKGLTLQLSKDTDNNREVESHLRKVVNNTVISKHLLYVLVLLTNPNLQAFDDEYDWFFAKCMLT